jgi:hydrogenase expression/formation protein HypD
MKFIEEFRCLDRVASLARALHRICTGSWTIMEVCGGQTHAIMKFGLHDLLPSGVRLIHGPGCPVCVTSVRLVDYAVQVARQPNVIVCSYADMLRVPGQSATLLSVRSQGGDVRMIRSALDVIAIAQAHPSQQVVFFSVGFETTAPAAAMAIRQARQRGINNISVIAANVRIAPALQWILQAPDNEVQAFLMPGHVCTITGLAEYERIAFDRQIPMAATGFEPVDLLRGLVACVEMLEKRRSGIVNVYSRSVRFEGNPAAMECLDEVFCIEDRDWRGIGTIPRSGFKLKDAYGAYDAYQRFPLNTPPYASDSQNGCISAEILLGKKRPYECPYFGKACTPEQPVGALMVSSEGACAAWYYR